MLCACYRAACVVCVCVQHYGTANPIDTPRQALFSILTPFADVRQDNHQIFRYEHKPHSGEGRASSDRRGADSPCL
jgi:hypothetical protein